MFDLFGADLPLPVKAVGAFVVVLGLILAATWLLRRFGGTRLGTTAARGRGLRSSTPHRSMHGGASS